ncbi:uncharacterized protein LOC135430225 isoform X2 [Drosophila montana]|uniref:uncharacterized protein LOC135430225 isoform X2 n=1 Tax=Drosophila montana TaxID=40370 RepID=UPI00313C996E
MLSNTEINSSATADGEPNLNLNRGSHTSETKMLKLGTEGINKRPLGLMLVAVVPR